MRSKRSLRTRGGKGRSSSDGRRPKSRRPVGENPTFDTSRIEKKIDKISSDSEEANLTENDLGYISSQLGSDEENIEAAKSQIKPYNVLLQSLGTSAYSEQSERKRRKLYQAEPPKDANAAEEDIDLVIDVEDPTNLETDELIDPEELYEIGEGRNLPFSTAKAELI